MNDQDTKIRKGLGPKRNSTSIRTEIEIVIPAGSILRAVGDDRYAIKVGFGGIAGEFSVTVPDGKPIVTPLLKRVVAA